MYTFILKIKSKTHGLTFLYRFNGFNGIKCEVSLNQKESDMLWTNR